MGVGLVSLLIWPTRISQSVGERDFVFLLTRANVHLQNLPTAEEGGKSREIQLQLSAVGARLLITAGGSMANRRTPLWDKLGLDCLSIAD